jgi:hypothetical protein
MIRMIFFGGCTTGCGVGAGVGAGSACVTGDIDITATNDSAADALAAPANNRADAAW